MALPLHSLKSERNDGGTMKTIQIKSILALGLLMALSTACGKTTAPASTGTVVSGLTSGTSGTSLAQQCSASPNVNSLSNANSTASQYRTCNNPNSAGSIELFKEDAATTNVCIFPAKVTNGSISLFISNPGAVDSSRYVVQCTTTRNPGIIVNFNGLDFNAIYVVNYADVNNMTTCIGSGTIGSCAAYFGFNVSYGQFN